MFNFPYTFNFTYFVCFQTDAMKMALCIRRTRVNVARVSCNITGNTCIFCNITRNTLHASASAVRVFLRIRRIHKADRNGAKQRVFLGRLLVALKRAGFS